MKSHLEKDHIKSLLPLATYLSTYYVHINQSKVTVIRIFERSGISYDMQFRKIPGETAVSIVMHIKNKMRLRIAGKQ